MYYFALYPLLYMIALYNNNNNNNNNNKLNNNNNKYNIIMLFQCNNVLLNCLYISINVRQWREVGK